jgi:hypothetical protein
MGMFVHILSSRMKINVEILNSNTGFFICSYTCTRSGQVRKKKRVGQG